MIRLGVNIDHIATVREARKIEEPDPSWGVVLAELGGAEVFRRVRHRSTELWRRSAFFRLLNRMLFRAAAPSDRWRVLRRIYRLDAGLIGRFYAGRPSVFDRVRILSGKPPVPVGRALRCVLDTPPPASPSEGRSA